MEITHYLCKWKRFLVAIWGCVKCLQSQISPWGCWSNVASTGAPAKGLSLQDSPDSPDIPQINPLDLFQREWRFTGFKLQKTSRVALVQSVLICHCSRNKWVMMRSWWEVVEFFASCKPEENAAQHFPEFDTRTWESHLTQKKMVQKSGGSCWGQKQEQIDLKELLAWFKICWSGGWWRPACQRTRKLHQGKTWIFWKCCEKQ